MNEHPGNPPEEPAAEGEAGSTEPRGVDAGAAPEAGEPAGGTEAKKPRSKSRSKNDDPDAVLEHAETPIPEMAEIEEALRWAFDGEEIEPAVLAKYARHARLVYEGNQVMNLTSIVDPREVAAKHYLDSWRATRLLPLIGRVVLDLGTGAGFPGVPVALAEPTARVTLLDSMKKRTDFVQRCVDELEIPNATVVCDRAEEHLARNKVDIVLVRAVSSARENVRLLRKVKHSVKDVVMLKGPSWSRETRAAEREAERLGFRMDTVWEHELPGEMGKRAILVYRAPGGLGL